MIVEVRERGKRIPESYEVVEYDRDTFVSRVFAPHFDWDNPHISIFAPTRGGKTTLMKELMNAIIDPDHPLVMMATKSRDAVIEKLIKELRLRRVEEWPPGFAPLRRLNQGRERGWVLWPPRTFDEEIDTEKFRHEFRKAISDSHRKGNRMLTADDMNSLVKRMKLGNAISEIHRDGGSAGVGVCASIQRPFDCTQESLSQPEHILIGNTPEERDLRRYEEIGGGFPGGLVRQISEHLPRFEFLYLRRSDRTMCLVKR